MTTAAQIAAQIEAHRRRWEAGDFRAVIDAVEDCHNWDRPLPDWLAAPVLYSLQFALREGGSPGKGKTGRFATQSARRDRDWNRWLAASAWLVDRPAGMTRDEALDGAHAMLAGTPHQGSPAAILASYRRVNRMRNTG